MFSLVILALVVTACSANNFHRIVNGENTDISKHSWQLSLQFASSGSHTCGAVLIEDNIALTAAHCVNPNKPSDYIIKAGVTRWDDWRGETVQIISIKHHPGYDVNGRYPHYPNDIAILHLNQRLPNSEFIKPISLASSDYAGTECNITGWGRTSGTTGGLPSTLQLARTEVLDHSTCTAHWGQGVSDKMHVCVYTRENGACNGDSGGPLVCGSGDRPELVGLASWVRSGCLISAPSVYTRVSNYKSWINENS